MNGGDDRLPTRRDDVTKGTYNERWLERRFKEAGPRPPLPEEDLARLHQVARRTWERSQDHDRPTPRSAWSPAWTALVAAGVACMALLGYWFLAGAWREAPALAGRPAAVARLERVVGEFEVRFGPSAAWARWAETAEGREIVAGAELRTGVGERAGRPALRWSDGASLRVDRESVVRLSGGAEVELARGALYVDSPPEATAALTILTPHGRFVEIGTQFEVRVQAQGAGSSRLRVREGRVEVARDGERSVTDAGQELTLRPGGPVERGAVLPFGEPWEWTLAAAPMLDIEGTSVRRFLDWAARESGWQLVFADRETEELAGRTLLHGSIRHLTPASAPAAVLPTAGLTGRVEGGALRISGGGEPRTPR